MSGGYEGQEDRGSSLASINGDICVIVQRLYWMSDAQLVPAYGADNRAEDAILERTAMSIFQRRRGDVRRATYMPYKWQTFQI